MSESLNALLATIDTNHDKTISAAEIAAAGPITVLGYSWGAVEAINFTRMLSAPNAHVAGTRATSGTPKSPVFTLTGGYNLTAAIPIKTLETLDPVLHAVLGLSGILKSTLGVPANVTTYQNYYETRGGTTRVEQFDGGANGLDVGPDTNFTIGNAFSSGIKGEAISSEAQNTIEINVGSTYANFNQYTPYRIDPTSGDVLYGRLKGSQVQHDTMPFYLEEIVISDLANG